jgi:hypothetical protein
LGALTKAVVLAETAEAVAVNVALLLPLAMVMDGGTVTLELDEVSSTSVSNGAGLWRRSVQLLAPGVCTVVGAQVRPACPPANAMVSTVDCTTVLALANIVALPPEAPVDTIALTLVVVLPAGIKIDPGKLTCGLPDESATVMPPCGAALVRESVQVLEPPGTTVVGLQLTAARDDGPLAG